MRGRYLAGDVQIFAPNGMGGPGFLGDGITPAPLANALRQGAGTLFRVSGAVNAETNLFTVEGKIFALAPVVPVTPPATFNRNASGAGTVDFIIPAPAGATAAAVSGVTNALPGEPITLMLACWNFTGSTAIVAPGPLLPASVVVTFDPLGPATTTQTFPLTDEIIGFTSGIANPAAPPTIVSNAEGSLTIAAASSNQFESGTTGASLLPTLVLTNPAKTQVGIIPGSGGTFTVPASAPTSVTITSTAAVGAPDPAGGTGHGVVRARRVRRGTGETPGGLGKGRGKEDRNDRFEL